MSRPPFISLKNAHVEDDISSGWHAGNFLSSSADYISNMVHFTGAILVKAAEVGVEAVREAIDRR